jgi:hypothetical protein
LAAQFRPHPGVQDVLEEEGPHLGLEVRAALSDRVDALLAEEREDLVLVTEKSCEALREAAVTT